MICKGSGIDYSLDEPSQGDVAVVVTFGATRFCMSFGPATGAVSLRDEVGRFVQRDAEAPAVCPLPRTGTTPTTPACGNGFHDPGETCDPPSTCPSLCVDGNACTTDVRTGSAATCDVECVSTPITTCAGADGCCPAGCTAANDGDCQ